MRMEVQIYNKEKLDKFIRTSSSLLQEKIKNFLDTLRPGNTLIIAEMLADTYKSTDDKDDKDKVAYTHVILKANDSATFFNLLEQLHMQDTQKVIYYVVK